MSCAGALAKKSRQKADSKAGFFISKKLWGVILFEHALPLKIMFMKKGQDFAKFKTF
jgi:hypothetical protein